MMGQILRQLGSGSYDEVSDEGDRLGRARSQGCQMYVSVHVGGALVGTEGFESEAVRDLI